MKTTTKAKTKAFTSSEDSGKNEHLRRVIVHLLSRQQVAERLGVCKHTVMRLTRKGALPALVFNRRLVRYEPAIIDAFIEHARIY